MPQLVRNNIDYSTLDPETETTYERSEAEQYLAALSQNHNQQESEESRPVLR